MSSWSEQVQASRSRAALTSRHQPGDSPSAAFIPLAVTAGVVVGLLWWQRHQRSQESWRKQSAGSNAAFAAAKRAGQQQQQQQQQQQPQQQQQSTSSLSRLANAFSSKAKTKRRK
jgi:hypothetical protein